MTNKIGMHMNETELRTTLNALRFELDRLHTRKLNVTKEVTRDRLTGDIERTAQMIGKLDNNLRLLMQQMRATK